MENVPYINVVGALNYLSTCTRPDIAFAVGALGSFNANPGQRHWQAAKRVLRYLKGSVNLCLRLGPGYSKESILHGYTDADYAGDDDKRRSTSGYALYIGSSLVSWKSKRQSIVALSTTEAEYIAAVSAGQEAIHLRQLLHELDYTQTAPTALAIDNQSTIRVAKNPEHQSRIKHIDIRMHWLRHAVQRKVLGVHYCPTGDNAADVLTKPLDKPLHEAGVKALGLVTYAG